MVEGWRGLWLEGSATRIEQIRKNFQAFFDERRLAVQEAFVAAENINALLEQGGVTGEIDFLSIDIDNNDYWVWKAITVIQPRVVVIEYNAALRPPLSLVVPYEPERRWDGATTSAPVSRPWSGSDAAKAIAWSAAHFAGANAFFVRDDIAGNHFLDPATAEEHYEPPRYYFAMLKGGHSARPGPYVAV